MGAQAFAVLGADSERASRAAASSSRVIFTGVSLGKIEIALRESHRAGGAAHKSGFRYVSQKRNAELAISS